MTCLLDIRSSCRSVLIPFLVVLGIDTVAFCDPQNDQSVQDVLSLQSRVQDIYARHHAAVVRVKATKEITVDKQSKRLLKMGSGFFVSKDGHVLTTGLLDDADRIWIEHLGSFYLAQKLGKDDLCNLTLLKVTNKPENFTFVPLSDSSDREQIGTFVVGLTCALEFEVGPTYGLLQSQEFAFGERMFPTKMLRCSLLLGPGEVGSPVFDLNGRFLGICYAALPDLQSSFVLPARACVRVRDDLLFSGQVEYGWFGITAARKLNAKNGFEIVIQNLLPDSPASKSKLNEGDIIKKIDGRVVKRQGDLADTAFFARPANIVEFSVLRDGKELKIPLRVEKRPEKLNLAKESIRKDEENSSLELNASEEAP